MASVRLKQSITFQDDGAVIPAGVYVVGKGITKKQFDAIKTNERFCEVLEVKKKVAPRVDQPVPESAV